RLVFNCFVMIVAWFLCDAKFKAERIVNLWMQVFFYAAGITIVCTLLKIPDATIVALGQAFLPIMGRPVWFAAEYLCMLLLTPFLNLLIERSEVVCRKLLIIFGGLIIVCATVFPIDHTTPAFSELVWFLFLYLFVAHFKRHPLAWMEKKGVCIMGAVLTYLLCILVYTLLRELGMGGLAAYYRIHYENALSFAASVFLFYSFKNMKIGNIKAINIVGESTFAVYVIHQTPCFYPTLWNGIFSVNEHIGKNGGVGYVVFVMAIIFTVSIVAEYVRKICFEHFVCTRKGYRWVCGKIGEFFEKL
ncbi:MAG: acyltransferase family protein, partial [Lachnospiraceae bacterium]|nr:acyltransferase family protein [Lachnospiraceae bacterium]